MRQLLAHIDRQMNHLTFTTLGAPWSALSLVRRAHASSSPSRRSSRGSRRLGGASTMATEDGPFEVSGDLFTLPGRQATILAEKLRLFAVGQFSDDVRRLEELSTSRAWLAGTREAADLIESALVDERNGPVGLLTNNASAARRAPAAKRACRVPPPHLG